MAGESFILMGVSGSGKTLIGSKVAALLSAKFIDGDDLHSPAHDRVLLCSCAVYGIVAQDGSSHNLVPSRADSACWAHNST